MRKSRLISHLSELDGIRRDEYMPQEVVDKVIELEQLLTSHLAKELEKPAVSGLVKATPADYDD